MESILEFLTLEHRIVHDLEHKKQFSVPKIYNAKDDLNKRWYVYFSFRNPMLQWNSSQATSQYIPQCGSVQEIETTTE